MHACAIFAYREPQATLSCPPAALYELAKHAENLESLANVRAAGALSAVCCRRRTHTVECDLCMTDGDERLQNLLRINEANGTALEWLMDLVSHEVMSSGRGPSLVHVQ